MNTCAKSASVIVNYVEIKTHKYIFQCFQSINKTIVVPHGLTLSPITSAYPAQYNKMIYLFIFPLELSGNLHNYAK